jgi:excisionase family DNA binding protein
MQAYANAEITPPTISPGLAAVSRRMGSVAPGTASAMPASAGTAPPPSTSAMLAALLVNDLDDDALALLARRLTPHLEPLEKPATRVAYTVESLAAELEVSAKTVRSAIARRELQGVKRGSRWIISARAVDEWASRPEPERTMPRQRTLSAPKLAGPSLRSVLWDGSRSVSGARSTR